MNPLTPDHHFYVDQGTNARLRIVVIAIGRKLVEAGALADQEDVVFLRYNELRRLMGDPGAFDAKDLVSDRRDDREDAFEKRPPSWLGTVTEEALAFPYASNWGFPERFHAGEPTTTSGWPSSSSGWCRPTSPACCSRATRCTSAATA